MLTGDEYYLDIAAAVARGADCTRRKVGAVLVQYGEIIGTGFNTSADRSKSCLEGDCPRGRHYRTLYPSGPPADTGPVVTFGKFCACGNDWPCPDAAIPYKSSYDYGETRCIADHAEVRATRNYTEYGATLYCTDAPCADCQLHLKRCGVARVVTPSGLVLFHENDR